MPLSCIGGRAIWQSWEMAEWFSWWCPRVQLPQLSQHGATGEPSLRGRRISTQTGPKPSVTKSTPWVSLLRGQLSNELSVKQGATSALEANVATLELATQRAMSKRPNVGTLLRQEKRGNAWV